jgi:hypothetical protein
VSEKSRVLTSLVLNSRVLRDVDFCRPVNNCRRFGRTVMLAPENKRSAILRNIDRNDTVGRA